MTEAKALARLCPGAGIRRLAFPVEPGWNALNPSIAMGPTSLSLVVRQSNFTVGHRGLLDVHDPDRIVRTRNWLCALDDGLCIADMHLVDTASVDGTLFYPRVRGLEDARLVWRSGRQHWEVYGTLRQHHPDGLPGMSVDAVTGNGDGGYRAVRRTILCNPENTPQKNWIRLGETDCYIYKCNPPSLVRRGALEVYEERGRMLDPVTRAFRGSSQAIAWSPASSGPNGISGYLAVTHEIALDRGDRRYFHRFALFDEHGLLHTYSEPFYFVRPTVEFCAGIAFWKGECILSFGYRDRRCYLAQIPMGEVEACLIQAASQPGERTRA